MRTVSLRFQEEMYWIRSHSCYIVVKDLPSTICAPRFYMALSLKMKNLFGREKVKPGTVTLVWLLVVSSSQVYSQNWEQKLEQKYFGKVQFGQKRNILKLGVVGHDC